MIECYATIDMVTIANVLESIRYILRACETGLSEGTLSTSAIDTCAARPRIGRRHDYGAILSNARARLRHSALKLTIPQLRPAAETTSMGCEHPRADVGGRTKAYAVPERTILICTPGRSASHDGGSRTSVARLSS